MSTQRLALDPPTGDLFILTRGHLENTVGHSRRSNRRRIIAPLHRSQDDALHRMINAIQPGSYVRPHRHLAPPKVEAWIVLRGRLLFLTFHDDGSLAEQLILSPDGDAFGVDLLPGVFHTIIALEPDTVIYEVKSGPYEQKNDKAFAPWAPEEGSDQAAAYLAQLLDSCGMSA